MNDWFYVKKLECFDEVKRRVDEFITLDHDNWIYNPWQCPGSRSIEIPISHELHSLIQHSAKVPLYNQWFIWDYLDAKELLIHKDTNSPGNGRAMAFIINLEGEFENKIYSDNDHYNPIDSVKYAVGDCMYLNNSNYYHGGSVLSTTRKTLSCWIDVYDKGLKDIL